ncbi:TfoX/Sxy family protein [Clostridium paraputrificum]|uniref:TfoX/Sxy family protein n=1 Tax=Clostridium TaxID=1485 RepID=UPI003D35210C
MGELLKVINIGSKLEEQLNEVGIETFEQLKKVGSKQAWLDIKAIDDSACINRLYALEGAIKGIRWHYLEDDVKKELKIFYSTVK